MNTNTEASVNINTKAPTVWKTYTNSQYGYSLSYPTNTKIDESSDTSGRSVFFQPPLSNGQFMIEAIKPSADCKDNTHGTNQSIKTIGGHTFAVSSADKYFSVKTSATAREYCIVKNSIEYKLYAIMPYVGVPVDVDEDITLNAMVKSFKLTSSDLPANHMTNSNTTSTAGWKTYDSGRGFAFKYPKDFIFDNGNSTPQHIIFTYNDQGERQFVITIENTDMSLEENVKATVANEKANSTQSASPMSVSYKPYTIGNVSGYLITSQSGDALMNTNATFKTQKNGNIFSFNYSYAATITSKDAFYAKILGVIASFN